MRNTGYSILSDLHPCHAGFPEKWRLGVAIHVIQWGVPARSTYAYSRRYNIVRSYNVCFAALRYDGRHKHG